MSKRRYVRPKKRNINQEAVARFLRQIGFETELLTQEWRHVLAFGQFRGKAAAFKLASTQKTAIKTQNEYRWNDAIHLIPEEQRPSFTVPQNYTCGYYGKLFYFIAERFLADPLVKRDSFDLTRVMAKLDQIARMSREIEMLTIPSDCVFAQNQIRQSHQSPIPIGEKLLTSTFEWAAQVPRDLSQFVAVVAGSKDTLRSAPSHGDFVSRHMYAVGKKIGITDGEHAGIRAPMHYDVAQFYVRLCLDQDGQTVATHYLHRVKALLSKADAAIFWDELKPVMIQRYIGELWGSSRDEKKLSRFEPLGRDILNDKILN